MTNEKKRADSEIVRLASLVSSQPIGPDSYKLNELLAGLASERDRLGCRRFLALLNQKKYDIDGLTDLVYLLESFDTQEAASAYIDDSAKSLQHRQLLAPQEYGLRWNLDSEGEIRFMTSPSSSNWAHPVRVLADRTYGLRASQYDKEYSCFRVIGPFSDHIVGDSLISFINEPFELWSFFVGAGNAYLSGSSRPEPS